MTYILGCGNSSLVRDRSTHLALGYLEREDFHLGAGFLALYCLPFMVGGLIVMRRGGGDGHRANANGRVDAEQRLFLRAVFVLMHHTYPGTRMAVPRFRSPARW